MYDYFIGKPTELNANAGRITLEVRGVGYDILLGDSLLLSAGRVSSADGRPLVAEQPKVGLETLLKLYTHFHTTEHKTALYGFLTKLKRETFRLLIRASGVGPQSALNIVLLETPQTILSLLSMKNKAGLTQFKGLGDRTAAKLILELAKPAQRLLEEYGEAPLHEDLPGGATATTLSHFPLETELRAALESLGYKEQEISLVLTQLQSRSEGLPESIEEAVRLALSELAITR